MKKISAGLRKIPLVYYTLAIILILNASLNPKVLTLKGLNNLMVQVAPTVFAVMAQTCAILIGEINLAIDGIINISNVVMALTMKTLGWFSILIVIGIGVLVGLMIGLVVTKLRVNSFIATLSFSMMLNGVSLLLLPKPGGYVDSTFSKLVRGRDLGLPNLLILMIVLLALWRIFRFTRQGLHIYATGGNSYSAFASGVHVDRAKILAYMISGFIVAVAALTISGKTMTGDSTIGNAYPMNSIAGALLGGAAFSGGKGTMLGAVAGGMIIAVLINILFFLNISSAYQYIVQAIILLISVLLSLAVRKRR